MFDVIVVGAGLAGLSAAVRLAAAGARLLVLEARPAAGGRAFSYRDPATGEAVDNGQHLLAGCYRETFGFLRAIGAESLVHVQESLEVTSIDAARFRTTLSCPPLPPPLHLAGGLFEWEAIGWADRFSALAMARPLSIARRQAQNRTTLQAASADETVAQWLARHRQTERLCEMFWNPLALATLNQPADAAAAPVFARVVGQMLGSERRDSALAWPTVPLTELYVTPARAFLEAHGGELRTGAPAHVHIEAGRIADVEVRGEKLETDCVIVAVPWHALTSTLAGDVTPLGDVPDRSARVKASPIVTVNLWLDRPVLDVPMLGLPGRTMQWVFNKRALTGGQATHLSLVSSGATEIDAMPGPAVVERALDELRDALPAARDAAVTYSSVVRERRATFSLAPGEPARPPTATPIPGLFLAGDWIDTGLPATIEGAVTSGHRAADAILR